MVAYLRTVLQKWIESSTVSDCVSMSWNSPVNNGRLISAFASPPPFAGLHAAQKLPSPGSQ
jgi:hypothetical protein